MRLKAIRPSWRRCIFLAAAWPLAAQAAVPADDLDALQLADQTPAAAPAPASAPNWRIFIEGAGGQEALRGVSGGSAAHRDTQRASLDARYDATLAPQLRGVLSDRLDLIRRGGISDNINTLREAYLSWAPREDRVVDLGRVNLRHGAALGYNPTDWFKEGALRAIVSPDPAVLRENRQGSWVLQGHQLWKGGALTAAVSPKFGDASTTPNTTTFTFNNGATNPRTRWLLAGSAQLGEKLNPEVLLYGGADTPTQLGLNLSAALGDATVLFGEFSTGRGRSVVARALNLNEADRNQRRAAAGLTYTTGFNLSLTAEAEYNSAGLSHDGWNALPATFGPAAPLGVLAGAQTLQDLPVRRAVFVYATWKDALVRRLDLSAFVRREAETRSRAQWLEARLRGERADVSLQWQVLSGNPGSVYATVPQRRVVELVLRGYF